MIDNNQVSHGISENLAGGLARLGPKAPLGLRGVLRHDAAFSTRISPI